MCEHCLSHDLLRSHPVCTDSCMPAPDRPQIQDVVIWQTMTKSTSRVRDKADEFSSGLIAESTQMYSRENRCKAGRIFEQVWHFFVLDTWRTSEEAGRRNMNRSPKHNIMSSRLLQKVWHFLLLQTGERTRQRPHAQKKSR